MGLSEIALVESTSAFGEVFEHFMINQSIALASYRHRNYRSSYLVTKDDAEIDLVVERPAQKVLFVEIKSGIQVGRHLTSLRKLSDDFGDCEAICFSCDSYPKLVDNIFGISLGYGYTKIFLLG